jgi:hypothetical protein
VERMQLSIFVIVIIIHNMSYIGMCVCK